jgi:hypothetical protein
MAQKKRVISVEFMYAFRVFNRLFPVLAVRVVWYFALQRGTDTFVRA